VSTATVVLPADRDHGVDGLDARLQRLVHRLAAHDAGGLDLDPALDAADDRALAVHGLAEGVDHPPEQRVADRDREDAAGGADGLALLDPLRLAEHHGADRLLVEVQRQADGAILELEQLVDGGVGQAGDTGDAITDLGDAPDGPGLERGLEALEVLGQGGGDVVCGDGQLSHGRSFRSFRGGT
jgi:hypothetical protein